MRVEFKYEYEDEVTTEFRSYQGVKHVTNTRTVEEFDAIELCPIEYEANKDRLLDYLTEKTGFKVIKIEGVR